MRCSSHVVSLLTCCALQLEASLMKFRNDLAIGGNVSAQTNVTPQTQVCRQTPGCDNTYVP